LLEVDANPNPLRSLTCGPVDRIVGGTTTLEERPGLGVDIELEALQEYAVAVHA
jgi:D-galactarolactone cycloisomerase